MKAEVEETTARNIRKGRQYKEGGSHENGTNSPIFFYISLLVVNECK